MNKKSSNKFSLLFEPYPYQFTFEHSWSIALFIGGFTFLFLFVFAPFGLRYDRLNMPFPLACFLYGLIPVIIIPLVHQLCRRFFPSFSSEEHWTLAKEMILSFVVLISIGVVIFFASFLIDADIGKTSLLQEFFVDLFHGILLGIIPMIGVIVANYIYILQQNAEKSKSLQEQLTTRVQQAQDLTVKEVRINSTVTNDNLLIDLNRLVYANADGNYIDFYLLEGQHIRKSTLRNSMKAVIAQLSAYPFLFRTHRSYLVNLNYIQHIGGNAQGYKLRLQGVEEEIPVSRKILADFDRVIKAIA